eukprot:gene14451-5513_t
MAKYVVAGKSDCPFFAKAELIADELQTKLVDFKVHKIVLQPQEWNQWVEKTCAEREWAYDGRSPLIWRELIDRGGKGILVGSCSDFLEIASGYYGIRSQKMTDELLKIAQENKETKIRDDEIELARKAKSNPLKICITAAANDVCYHLLVALCNLKVFPDEKEVTVCLLDDDDKHDILEGSCMELTDSAPGQLKEVYSTSSMEKAFNKANLVIVLDGLNFQIDEPSNKDNLQYFGTTQELDLSFAKSYGEILSQLADKNVKVVVAGGPSNLICNIMIAAVKDNMPWESFFALSRLDENKAKNVIAQRLNVKTADVKNVVVWGQPHYQQIIDVSQSRVVGYDGAIWGPHINGFSHDTKEMVHDEKWLLKQLEELSLQKQIDQNKLRGTGSAISVAAAILDQLYDLYNGSKLDQIYSVALASKGWYDIPEGLVFSVPVNFNDGKVEVVSTLELNEDILQKLKDITIQLKEHTDKVLACYGLSL